jgi:hypothetical protein
VDEGEVVFGLAIEPCCEAPEVLELVEATLDAVSELVDQGIVGRRSLA